MKKLYIVANWKSNFSSEEANNWLEGFKIEDIRFKKEEKEVIICASFTLLSSLKSYLLKHSTKGGLSSGQKSSLVLGAQDVSPFPKGAYTGEVAADQLKEFVSYVIIGHSERRKYFHEDNQMLQNKVDITLGSGLIPIFCVQDANTIIPKGVEIVAYEPVFAIGTGEPDSPENAEEVARKISDDNSGIKVLYGGSVTDKNVATFTKKAHISGVLVGSASLNPSSLTQIISNA